MSNLVNRRAIVAALALAVAAAAPAFAATPIPDATGVRLVPDAAAPAYRLRVTGPEGFVFERAALPAEAIAVAMPAAGWADGAYAYEIVALKADAQRRADGDAVAPEAPVHAESGSFHVQGGVVYVADALAGRTDAGTNTAPQPNDQVISDDLIVQGSTCTGFDCVSGEFFNGFGLVVKENNTRIRFDDTSVLPGFPGSDWQLTANDATLFGLNKFSIEDITSATVPFTLSGGAPSNALFVDATGRVGLGTSTPLHDIHMSTGDTPTIRFEQHAGTGFPAQTWDVVANEIGFFLRDMTGGLRVPFRIRPGAPSGSIEVNALGQVGVGTVSPAAKVHVSGGDGATQVFVAETSATATGRDLLRLENRGPTRIRMKNLASAYEWSLNAHDNDFRVTVAGAATPSMTIFPNGNVTIAGTLTQNSDRNSKENFKPLDHKALLEKIARLDITEWNFKSENQKVRHIGPMAQDFHSVFGLGEREDRIAPLDTSGVALAAVQGLQREIAARDARIAQLEASNARMPELQARIERLDALTQRLARVQEEQAVRSLPTAMAAECAAPAKVAASGL